MPLGSSINSEPIQLTLTLEEFLDSKINNSGHLSGEFYIYTHIYTYTHGKYIFKYIYIYTHTYTHTYSILSNYTGSFLLRLALKCGSCQSLYSHFPNIPEM